MLGNSVDVEVENIKQNVDAFLVIVRGDKGQDNIEIFESLSQNEAKTFSAQFNPLEVGNPEVVDIIPKLFIGPGIYEPCSSKKVSYEVE